MSIIINDNFAVNVGKPIDSKYLNITSPWTSVGAAEAAIPLSYRYTGLTVNVLGTEYWWSGGTANGQLVQKKYESEQLIGDFITGATNLGFFEGTDSVQTLLLSGFPYDGLYNSKLQWYYGDSSGIIRIGSPTHDGPLRRTYVRTDNAYSWIYNVQVAGWSLATGLVPANVGNAIIDNSYGTPRYTEEDWTVFVSSGTTSINPSGSLTTGATITIGNPIYSHKSNQDLHLRTIINDTPEFLNISTDDYYVRFSGISSVIDGGNVGSGASVYAQRTGTTLQFRTLVSSGDTTVTQVGDEIRIYSAGGTGSISVANLSGGTGDIYKDTSGTTINLRTLLGTGDVTITTTGDTVVIDSQGGGGTYDLESPSVIDVGGICSGTELTGKTSFELWEELLVPTQYPALTTPSVSTSLFPSTSTYEVGTTIPSLDVCSSYNAGVINPVYPPTASSCRSDGVIGYCYTSTYGQVDGYYVDGVTLHVENISTYVVSALTQTWITSACHCSGVQPYDSKGDTYLSGLTTGFTATDSSSITGIYTWFWGTHPSGTAPDVSTSACAQCLLNSYTCNCLGSSTSTINVNNFNATGEYLWFAIPSCASSKTSWEDVTNPSNVGTIPGTLMANPAIQSVSSPDGLPWICNYEFYVSNYATNVNYGINFYN